MSFRQVTRRKCKNLYINFKIAVPTSHRQGTGWGSMVKVIDFACHIDLERHTELL